MNPETEERWFKLCQQASVEQDPGKLLALVTEINQILEVKEMQLEQARKNALGSEDRFPTFETSRQLGFKGPT